MKIERSSRNQKLLATALLALACGLALSTHAAQRRQPVFQEIPGVTQPLPPPPAPVAAIPPASVVYTPPPAPVTAPEVAEDKTVYSFQASALDLRTALATFARANNLNIVPDNDVSGTVTVDVRDLPLKQMMRALLEASDCSWQEDGGLIRVRSAETRTFVINYLRLSRTGKGLSSATLGSSSGGSVGGSGGGAGAGAGGGSGGGMGGSIVSSGTSTIDVTADNKIDFWQEIEMELGKLLTPANKDSLAINKTAGIIQVNDRPSALKRVETYLQGVDSSIHRQVEIEVKLYDVTLNDQFQFGIDWNHVTKAYGGTLGFGAATLPLATGGGQIAESALGGINRIVGEGNVGGNPNTLVYESLDTAAAVNALKLQGNVEVISQPRLRTLNNHTALIKVGTETPFFSQVFDSRQTAGGNITTSGDKITTITVGTILSITPQISDLNWVSLDISPVLTSLVATEESPSGTATAPVLDTKQASTIVRVRSGATVILGGLIQTEKASNAKKVPVLGDIPGLGKLFTGTYKRNIKRELVIFVTPRVIPLNEASVQSNTLSN